MENPLLTANGTNPGLRDITE